MDSADVLRPSVADASVRPAHAGDATAIGAVQARAWRAAYAGILEPSALERLTADALAEPWHDAVCRPPTGRHAVLVACAGSTVVGFAAVAPSTDPDAGEHDGALVVLAVDPAHRGAGHGSRLLSASADTLRSGGARTVRAWVPDDDEPLRAFLASAGAVPDGARRTYAAQDGREVVETRLSATLGA
ncbi:MAG: N-acetyltransferase family protein [Kineosporiaceae bacterium]